jgi:hypothetical protein
VYRVTNIKNLLTKTNLLFKKNKHVALSPYKKIDHEFRAIVYKNKPQLIFDKKRSVS